MGLVALSAEGESLAQWGQAWTSCHHGCCSWESHSFPRFSLTGVEFGARMVNIDGKQIKLQIWDTVRENKNTLVPNITVKADAGIKGYDGGAKDGGQSSVQSLSRVQLFVTPWTAARQASLSITNSWNLLKLMSIESVMPSNHLILCHPLLLLPSIFPTIRIFSNESVLRIRWQKYWSFSFSISPPSEYSGLISFRMD